MRFSHLCLLESLDSSECNINFCDNEKCWVSNIPSLIYLCQPLIQRCKTIPIAINSKSSIQSLCDAEIAPCWTNHTQEQIHCQCCRCPLFIHDDLAGARLMSGSDEDVWESSDICTSFDNVEEVEWCDCSWNLACIRCCCCMCLNCCSLDAKLITLSSWFLLPSSVICRYGFPEVVRFNWSPLKAYEGTVFNRVCNILKAPLCWGSNIRRPYKVVNKHV